MPHATYTADGGTYRIAGHSFEPGDTHEVDREVATHLADVDDFDVSIEKDAAKADAEDDDVEAEAESGTDSTDADEFDVGAFLNRTPVEDIADDILAGAVDEHLDAVADEASRVTVQDAIGERRAELED